MHSHEEASGLNEGFVHQALIYGSDQEFMEVVLPFVGEGLRSDEPTELIPADFWWRFEVSFFELVAGARTLRSQPAPGNRWASDFLYKDLATRSATVEMLWPDLRGQWQLSSRTR